jgi:ribose-phosphate pyrophosphokinase
MIRYNGREITFGKYPNGEVNLRKIRIDPRDINHVVTLKYENDADLFHLLLVRKALDVPVTLRITYAPYSRMDRESDTYTFSLKVFTEFINSMNWERVVIYEPHSDVLPALLDRVQVVNVTGSPLMHSKLNIAFNGDPYQVFYPDAGAQKRYAENFKDHEHLVGFKTRDFETGRILNSYVVGERKMDNVAIVDDLCSKGGTFVLAARHLADMGFKKIILLVAHCEYTAFLGEVFTSELFSKVITTDSIMDQTHGGGILDVIPLTEFKWRYDEHN